MVQWLIVGFLFAFLPLVHAGIQAGTLPPPGPYMANIGGLQAFTAGLIANIMFGLAVAAIYHGFLTLSEQPAQGRR